MKVKEVMTRPAKVLVPAIPVEVALSYMNAKRLHRMPVVTHRVLVGIVTENDLIRAMRRGAKTRGFDEVTVGDVMTRTPTVVRPETELRAAARMMATRRFHALPVVVSGKVVGVITQSDVVRAVTGRRAPSLSIAFATRCA